MSSHYRFYAASNESVVPFNATYQFPSQANKAVKSTTRIVPKSGNTYTQGNVIRFEFPADGYMNVSNTTFIMDVSLGVPTNAVANDITLAYSCRFQQNIQSIFTRVRVLYGATPIEDIINYNIIVRFLTEWTAGNPHMVMDQSTINEGIGGVTYGADSATNEGLVNIRTYYIQGSSFASPDANSITYAGPLPITVVKTPLQSVGVGKIPYSDDPVVNTAPANTTYITRRYQFQIAAGIFQQPKLVPLKYMASQFAVEFTLETNQACITTSGVGSALTSFQPTYVVGNCYLLSETLTFDPSYDEAFLQGLYTNGVPIKFASWHYFSTTSALGSTLQYNVTEMARSVKALFALQRRAQPSFLVDNGASFMDTGLGDGNVAPSTLQSYQWRIGTRMFPSSPVQVSTTNGSGTCNGGAEAYTELAKALNILGDYRLSTPLNVRRWALQNNGGILQELDYTMEYTNFTANGTPLLAYENYDNNNAFASTLGPQQFAMAINLETTNGVEISGLNSEEQSGIALVAYWKKPQVTGSTHNDITGGVPSLIEVYSYYDALFILKENNQAVVVN